MKLSRIIAIAFFGLLLIPLLRVQGQVPTPNDVKGALEPNFQNYREAEFVDRYAESPDDSANKCVLKEVGKSSDFAGVALRYLQLHYAAWYTDEELRRSGRADQDDASYGRWADRSSVDDGRIAD